MRARRQQNEYRLIQLFPAPPGWRDVYGHHINGRDGEWFRTTEPTQFLGLAVVELVTYVNNEEISREDMGTEMVGLSVDMHGCQEITNAATNFLGLCPPDGDLSSFNGGSRYEYRPESCVPEPELSETVS